VAILLISEELWIFAESKYSEYMLSPFVLLIPGSPAILGDREEDVDADEVASDFNYTSEDQNQKQKIAERMLSWHMTYGRGEDVVVAPTYDKGVSHNHIPLLTNGTEVIQQASEYYLSSS
jgi:hypothetical protein